MVHSQIFTFTGVKRKASEKNKGELGFYRVGLRIRREATNFRPAVPSLNRERIAVIALRMATYGESCRALKYHYRAVFFFRDIFTPGSSDTFLFGNECHKTSQLNLSVTALDIRLIVIL